MKKGAFDGGVKKVNNKRPLRDLGSCKSHQVFSSTRSSFKNEVHVKRVSLWYILIPILNSKLQVWNLQVYKGTNCIDIQ